MVKNIYYDVEQLLALYKESESITSLAKKYCKINDFQYSDTVRRSVSKIIHKNNKAVKCNNIQKPVKEVVEEVTETPLLPSAWSPELYRFLSPKEFCDKFGLPFEDVLKAKLVSHNSNHISYNIKFKNDSDFEPITEEFIEKLVKDLCLKPTLIAKSNDNCGYKHNNFIDRLVLTDIHIGMNPSGGRNTVLLYDTVVWNEDELFNRLNQTINHVKKFKKGNTILIDELGDFLDGYEGQTTRKGHELPQNMNDKEMFEVGVKFKLELITQLLNLGYTKIISNNITNDNHSGTFSYLLNFTVKQILEVKFPKAVEYNILERFINHYSIDDYTFLLCHGKDDKDMKFGFKPTLDSKQSEKIDQYCKAHGLYNGKHIEFSKGDSHQGIFDFTTSNDFDYCNYPAFSPPSNWVMTNFKNTKSGFYFSNIEKGTGIKITIPYWF